MGFRGGEVFERTMGEREDGWRRDGGEKSWMRGKVGKEVGRKGKVRRGAGEGRWVRDAKG